MSVLKNRISKDNYLVREVAYSVFEVVYKILDVVVDLPANGPRKRMAARS